MDEMLIRFKPLHPLENGPQGLSQKYDDISVFFDFSRQLAHSFASAEPFHAKFRLARDLWLVSVQNAMALHFGRTQFQRLANP